MHDLLNYSSTSFQIEMGTGKQSRALPAKVALKKTVRSLRLNLHHLHILGCEVTRIC